MLIIQIPEYLENRLRSAAERNNCSVSHEVIETLKEAYDVQLDQSTHPNLYELALSDLPSQQSSEELHADVSLLLKQVIELQQLLPEAYKTIEKLTKQNADLEEKIHSCCPHALSN